jgi:hypothetical protein
MGLGSLAWPSCAGERSHEDSYLQEHKVKEA